MSELNIGIVGGWGWIGRALTEGILAAGIVDSSALLISGRAARPAGIPPQIRYVTDGAQLIAESSVVILSVRPEQFAQMDLRSPDRLLVSVMAAVPAAMLAERMATPRVVRAMPSAAASIGKSFTPLFAGAQVSDADKGLVRRIFSTVGRAVDVPLEAHLDYMTGLTGSGPGFVALLAQAMQAHAATRGLDPELAREAVRATMEAAGEMLGRGTSTPQEITDGLRAYRGTTAAALEAMESAGFVAAVEKGLEAAQTRLQTMIPLLSQS